MTARRGVPSKQRSMTRLTGSDRVFPRIGFALCFLVLSSCSPPSTRSPVASRQQPDSGEFSIMTYNLHRYAVDDRDGDGQKNDPKPVEEREAAAALIALVRPDVLAVQEIGGRVVFEEFLFRLKTAGLEYPHLEHLQRGDSEINLALLSRFPIVSRQHHTNEMYTIGPAEIPVARGFLDVEIEVNPEYRFRVLVGHLKSKVFHPLGQTEMRRNEARLLNKNVRKILKENPEINLVVVGDMNDTYNSAALRELMGEKKDKVLFDLRPIDRECDAWTHYTPDNDEYARIDYLLVSSGMRPEVVTGKTYAVRSPLTYQASDHRPLVAVFQARETKESLPEK